MFYIEFKKNMLSWIMSFPRKSFILAAIVLLAISIGFFIHNQNSKNPSQSMNRPPLPAGTDPFTQSPKQVQECISKIIGTQALSDLQSKKRPANIQEQEASKACLTEYYRPNNFQSFSKSYSKEITNDQSIILTGNQILEISDTHYIQKNDITLKDNAKLIIKNSFFEHLGDSSFKYWLNAQDKSQVVVQDSKIKSTPWLNWNFYNSSSLTLNNVDQSESGIWYYFPDDSKVNAKNSNFKGTLANNAQADIDGSNDTFIELVFLPGSKVDEKLPKTITNQYIFPNNNDKIEGKMRLSLKNSKAPNWGITVTEDDKITIRDTENLTVTFSFGYKFINEVIELSDLKAKKYTDSSWNFKDTALRLINVKTNKWSPIAGEENTLIIKNSQLADNAFSNNKAKIIIENSTAQFLRAKDYVQMTVRDSEIEGDVVAEDNGKINLINTKVGGKKVEKGQGKITER